MMELRPYQKEAVQALWRFWRNDPAGIPIIVAPTGSGKSILISEICRQVCDQRPDYKILILSHRKEILDQNARKIQSFIPGLPIGVYSAGLRQKTLRKITVAGIQSIVRILKSLEKIQLLLIDECHLISNRQDSMYQKVITELRRKSSSLKIAGFSATPYRLDQGSLLAEDSLFTDIAYDISIRELIDSGYLCNITSRVAKSTVDMEGVKIIGYEYDQEEMERRFDERVRTHCEEIIKAGADRKSWLIFCSGIGHTMHMSDCLNAMGIKSDYVHSEMMDIDRDKRINGFREGKTRAICNCQILTTGFDSPAIDLLGLVRATKSTSLYVQMVGRSMRTHGLKSNALILDFGGNIQRHGPIDTITVKAKKDERKAEIRKAPTKICPKCGEAVAANTKECSCGYIYPLAEKLDLKASYASILSEIETCDVTWHNFKVHMKEGKPPSLKITYGSGPRVIHEFLCFEHGGYATKKARELWTKRGGLLPPPEKTEQAFLRCSELVSPQQIKIRPEGKYYRVIETIGKKEDIEKDELYNKYGLNI